MITFLATYLLGAIVMMLYLGISEAIDRGGKVSDLDNLVPAFLGGIFWPFVVMFLGFLGIAFGYKWICEKIAGLIMRRKTLDSGNITIKAD